jgi:hypothetical protein
MSLPWKNEVVWFPGALQGDKFFDEGFACESLKDGFFAVKQKLTRKHDVFEQGAALEDVAEDRYAMIFHGATATPREL